MKAADLVLDWRVFVYRNKWGKVSRLTMNHLFVGTDRRAVCGKLLSYETRKEAGKQCQRCRRLGP